MLFGSTIFQRPALYPLLAACLWGGMYVVSKASFDALPPLTLGAARLAVGIAPLWRILRRTGHSRLGGPLPAQLALGGLIAFSLATQFLVGAITIVGGMILVTTRIPSNRHPPSGPSSI
jgi:drug/metabolite transporter (DMT)-like permease